MKTQGPGDNAGRCQPNIQPVIPISLNDDWNIISRAILPVVLQDDIFPGAGSQSGLGDVMQSVFFFSRTANSNKSHQIGNQLVSFGGGVRYWTENTDVGLGGPRGRLIITLLFPK